MARNNLLIGVASHGSGTCAIGIPDVYTRVSEFADWISEQTNGKGLKLCGVCTEISCSISYYSSGTGTADYRWPKRSPRPVPLSSLHTVVSNWPGQLGSLVWRLDCVALECCNGCTLCDRKGSLSVVIGGRYDNVECRWHSLLHEQLGPASELRELEVIRYCHSDDAIGNSVYRWQGILNDQLTGVYFPDFIFKIIIHTIQGPNNWLQNSVHWRKCQRYSDRLGKYVIGTELTNAEQFASHQLGDPDECQLSAQSEC